MNNFDMMRKRLEFQGGIKQEDRMIKDKYNTFLKTLKYSYQGADVRKVQYFDTCFSIWPPPIGDKVLNEEQHRALINPDKTKMDYDDKILSIDYAYNFHPGDIFQWIGTNTYWLVYLQALTEDAYFRSEIRRCSHLIKFKDKNGIVKYTWAAIRGPVETQIESIQKNQIRIDRPNLSLNILLPQNEDTLFAFERYKEFLLEGRCWKVQVIDSISTENIIEVAAEEDYINRDIDDTLNELKDGLIIEPVDPNPHTNEPSIEGETFIKPKITEIYKSPFPGGRWCTSDAPVNFKPISDTEVEITWYKSVSGQFTLTWKDDTTTLQKIIVVESLF